MSSADLDDRAAEFRHAFDRTFAEPILEAREDAEALLGVRVAEARYAVRLVELAGIFMARRIVPVPSAAPALLGLVGFRGTVIPVYGLHQLLGHPSPREPPRWIVLVREECVGFAVDQLDDHLSVVPSEITAVHGEAPRGHVREIVRVSATTRSVVSIHSVVAAIGSQIGVAETIKER
jgi:chemotaxis signal transduction protein